MPKSDRTIHNITMRTWSLDNQYKSNMLKISFEEFALLHVNPLQTVLRF